MIVSYDTDVLMLKYLQIQLNQQCNTNEAINIYIYAVCPLDRLRSFFMAKKACAHETSSIIFKRDGVPSMMVRDGSKVQTLGLFRKKYIEATYHVR